MTSVRGCSSVPRRRMLALALAVACLLPTACTSAEPASMSTSRVKMSHPEASVQATSENAVASAPTPGDRTAPDPAAGSPGSAAGPVPTPDPEMTVIESAALCTLHRQRDDASYFVPVQEVFEGQAGVGWSGATEVVPGPDAADPSRCPGELPPQAFCEVAVPWTGMSDDTLITAGRLHRAVAGSLESGPGQAEGAAPADAVKGVRRVLYEIYDLPSGDPAGVNAYLDRAVRTCAKARPVSVAGTPALVGKTRSDSGAPSAQIVLLNRGSRLLWVVLDGDGWKGGQREHALGALVRHLL
ncbi:MAG: hypothetical protein ABI336_06525 [Humibacillus sp.]